MQWLKSIFIGRARNLSDERLFHKIWFVAVLAWVGVHRIVAERDAANAAQAEAQHERDKLDTERQWPQLKGLIGSPPDAQPDEGAALISLKLLHIGPATASDDVSSFGLLGRFLAQAQHTNSSAIVERLPDLIARNAAVACGRMRSKKKPAVASLAV